MTAQAARLVGDEVVLAAATAARLAPVLRAAAARARRDGLVLDGDLVQVLDVVQAAERLHPRRPARPAGPSLAPVGSGPPRSGRLGVGEVARRVGVTERAVRKAAATGRLVGRLGPDGAWWFTPQAADQWRASRRRRSA